MPSISSSLGGTINLKVLLKWDQFSIILAAFKLFVFARYSLIISNKISSCIEVVILGSTGRNIGAGMTGGIAFIIDENNDLSNKVNKEIVSIHKITTSKQEDILLEIIREYRAKTNSLKAAKIIENWSYYKSTFKLIVPPSEEEILGIKKI